MPFDLKRLDTVQLIPLTPFSADGKHLRGEVLSDLLGELRRGADVPHSPAVREVQRALSALRAVQA